MKRIRIGTLIRVIRGINSGRRARVVEIRRDLGRFPIYVMSYGAFLGRDEFEIAGTDAPARANDRAIAKAIGGEP